MRDQPRGPDPSGRPSDPDTGVRVPKGRGPRRRSGSAAVAEPDDNEGAVAVAGRKNDGVVVKRHDQSLTLAKNIDDGVYPDVARLGSLANALKSALGEIGSGLVSGVTEEFRTIEVYARVESGPRFSQVRLGAERRMFCFDCWSRGVCLATGRSPHLDEVARAIDRWVGSSCTTAESTATFSFVTATEIAVAYERGEAVEYRWQRIREWLPTPLLLPFLEAALRRPELRQLLPYAE